jgi:hypothetical protein
MLHPACAYEKSPDDADQRALFYVKLCDLVNDTRYPRLAPCGRRRNTPLSLPPLHISVQARWKYELPLI